MQTNNSTTKSLFSAEESISILLDEDEEESRETLTDKLLGNYVDGNQDKDGINLQELEADKWLNPYSRENFGIICSYFSCGFGGYFIQTPLAYYMVCIVILYLT